MSSPTAKLQEVVQLDFIGAMKAIKEGSRVTRMLWNDPNVHVTLHEGKLSIRWNSFENCDDGTYNTWTISEADVYAYDWKVVTES